MRISRWYVVAGWVLFVGAGISAPQEPDGWRGPGRDGVVRDAEIPASLPAELRKVWSVEVGAGLSTPLVAGDRIYVTTREGEDELVSARSRRDGGLLWSVRKPAPFIANQQAANRRLFPVSQGRGPFATPALAEGILVTLSVDRTVTALRAEDGKLLWRHQLLPAVMPNRTVFECPPCGMECDGKEYSEGGKCPNATCPLQLSQKGLETSANYDGTRGNYYGAASSPVIHRQLVILNVGNAEAGQLMAYDLHSGEERWRWEGQGVSSSSPVVAEIGGVTQVVTLNRTSLNGIDVRSGQELWSFPVSSNAQIVTPVVAGNLVVFSVYRSPATAVRIGREGAGWTAETAWANTEITLNTNTPVLVDGILYGLSYSGRGRFFAIDVQTGELKWATEGREGGGASIQSIGARLLTLLDSGQLRVLSTDPTEYRVEASYTVSDSPTWAHPVFFGNQFLVKNESELTLYEWN